MRDPALEGAEGTGGSGDPTRHEPHEGSSAGGSPKHGMRVNLTPVDPAGPGDPPAMKKGRGAGNNGRRLIYWKLLRSVSKRAFMAGDGVHKLFILGSSTSCYLFSALCIFPRINFFHIPLSWTAYVPIRVVLV